MDRHTPSPAWQAYHPWWRAFAHTWDAWDDDHVLVATCRRCGRRYVFLAQARPHVIIAALEAHERTHAT
jgi:hypothetical protein